MYFLINGTAGDPRCYNQDEEMCKLIATGPNLCQGVMKPNHSNSKERTNQYIVDSAVLVTTFTNQCRNDHLNYWTKKKLVAVTTSVIGTALCTTISGISVASTLPLILVVSALTASVALTALGLKRYFEASCQKKQWMHSLLTDVHVNRRHPVEERIFEDKLKGSVFHPDEVTEIWTNYAKEYMRKYQKMIDEKTIQDKDISFFFTNNPLTQKRREYASAKIDMNLAAYFDHVERSYNGVEAEYQKSLKELEEMYTEELRKINEEKNKALEPFKKELDTEKLPHSQEIAKLEITKSDGLILASNDEQKQRDVLRNHENAKKPFDQKLKELQLIYENDIKPIERKFSSDVKALEKWFQKEIEGLRKRKSDPKTLFCPAIKCLCTLFLSGKTDKKKLPLPFPSIIPPNKTVPIEGKLLTDCLKKLKQSFAIYKTRKSWW